MTGMVTQVKRVAAHPFISLISANFLRMICVLLINKIASVRLSATDFGLFGQFIAVVAVANMVSTAGLTNAVIRDVSLDSEEGKRLSREYFWLTLLVSLLAALTLALLAPLLSTRVFGTEQSPFLLWIIALALPLLGITNFFISFFSGIGSQTLNGRIQAMSAGGGMLLFAMMTWQTHNLSIFSIAYILFLIVSVAPFLIKNPLPLYWVHLTWDSVRGKLGDSATMFAAILFLPTALVGLRGHLAQLSGWDTVALWQVLARLSDSYIQIFAIYYSHIFFKRLITSNNKRGLVIRHGLINIGAMSGIGFTLYFFFELIVRLLFSSDYVAAIQFLPYQLAIDAIKVMTIILMYSFLSQKMFWQYIITEILQTILLVLLQLSPLMHQGLSGVYAMLLICQIFGFLVAIVLVLSKLRRRQQL